MSAYTDKFKDPRWQMKRLEIFKRDSATCQNCSSKTKTLHAHHLYYEKGKDPWDYPLDAYATLCESCHWCWHDVKLILDKSIGYDVEALRGLVQYVRKGKSCGAVGHGVYIPTGQQFLPDGNYVALVDSSVRLPQSNGESDCVCFTLCVYDGEFEGLYLKDVMSPWHSDDDLRSRSLVKVTELVNGCGKETIKDTDELDGCVVGLHLHDGLINYSSAGV